MCGARWTEHVEMLEERKEALHAADGEMNEVANVATAAQLHAGKNRSVAGKMRARRRSGGCTIECKMPFHALGMIETEQMFE